MNTKLNLGCGDTRLPGFVNLDRQSRYSDRINWTFGTGLPFETEGVSAITMSHLLSSVPIAEWHPGFQECHRVLIVGGTLRITDDDQENPRSRRFLEPFPGTKCNLTGPRFLSNVLLKMGFKVAVVPPRVTMFKDDSLIQAYRETDPPYTFHIEGVKL